MTNQFASSVPGGRALNTLQQPDPIWAPYAFDRVTIIRRALVPATTPHGSPTSRGPAVPVASILGKVYSPYPSGPALFSFADACGELFGPGFYAWDSIRALGFRA